MAGVGATNFLIMYTFLLQYHSWFRWIVIINLIAIFAYVWYHKKQHTVFTKQHYTWIKITNIVLSIQFIIGISLFMDSAIAKGFWQQLPESISIRQIRFFGLEHPFMMILGVILSNYFTYRLQDKINSKIGFSYAFKWLLLIVLIIFSSIPWAFSPLTSRPNFRF